MTAIERDLADLVGSEQVLPGTTAAYLSDATESRGVRGRADAIVLPRAAEETAAVVAWCAGRGVAVVPRGGGTGLAGGCVPAGGVVRCTERLVRVRSFDPLLWRTEVEAGVRTGDVHRRARENGLVFPPDPGAAEQSHIGGNVATNAGGPHAFKYGVTGQWVTGLEAVLPSGELVRVGGPVRKDVAGYDLRGLLVGSEGTLGVVTSVRLRLLPAPEATLRVVAFSRMPKRAARRSRRSSVPASCRPRSSTSTAARSRSPGRPIPARCPPARSSPCWPRPTGDGAALERAEHAAGELFALARELGGTISGEHGLGTLKRGQAGWPEPVAAVQRAIKAAFDPDGLMNPGKKI